MVWGEIVSFVRCFAYKFYFIYKLKLFQKKMIIQYFMKKIIYVSSLINIKQYLLIPIPTIEGLNLKSGFSLHLLSRLIESMRKKGNREEIAEIREIIRFSPLFFIESVIESILKLFNWKSLSSWWNFPMPFGLNQPGEESLFIRNVAARNIGLYFMFH